MIDSYLQGPRGRAPDSGDCPALDWSRAVGKRSAALLEDFPPTIRDALAGMGLSSELNAGDALFGAARRGDAAIVELLAQAPFSSSMILLAIKASAAEGAASCVEALLRKIPAGHHFDGILSAANARSPECVELLLPFSDKDTQHKALRLAIFAGSAACVPFLSRGICPDQGAEVLSVCIASDQPVCARIILDAISAHPPLPPIVCKRLLFYSAAGGHSELLGDILRLLLDGDKLVEAIRIAAKHGSLECLRMLMAKDDMREADIPALLAATDSDHFECAAELLPLIQDSANFWCALRVAARKGSLLCAKHFISMLPPHSSSPQLSSWRSSAPEGSALSLMPRPSLAGFHSFAETARGHGQHELSTFFKMLAEQDALLEAIPAPPTAGHAPRL